MEANYQFEGLDPANQFTMEGKNMAFAAELIYDGKPLPKELFLDIMIKKDTDIGYSFKTFSIWTSISSKY